MNIILSEKEGIYMKLSILNLVPLRQGQTYGEAIEAMVRLAQHAENIGLERYWIAEHHNMPNLASSSTQILIGHALSKTKSIHVGSGGVMLPNHSPYIVAEQYGTLDVMYPGRVELGLGRAPGTDMRTAYAIRRHRENPEFADDLEELLGYFKDNNLVSAYPAVGRNVPFYILGSSTDSAYLAAELGRPYAFAAHFAPRMMKQAVTIYRQNFKPSPYLTEPYVIMGANVIIGDTMAEAKSLATTHKQWFLNIVTDQRRPLQPPVESMKELWDNHLKAQHVPHFGPVDFRNTPLLNREKAIVEEMSACSLIGDQNSVAEQVKELADFVEIDEIMAVSYIYDEAKQIKSYTQLKEITDNYQD